MSLSDLETALLAAGRALSTGQLGRDLRRFHPGRRGSRDHFSFLAAMELNHPPPIQRTIRIIYTASSTGFDLHLSDGDRAYLAWIRDAKTLLQALADSWWGAINPDLRVLFVDGDDAPPIVLLNQMFPGLRARRPPSLRPAAQALGLGDVELSALSEARRAAHHTAVYEGAARIGRQIRADARRRRALQREKDSIMPELALRPMGRRSDEADRLRNLVDSAYSDADDWIQWAARGLRAYNELVHSCLAFLLGYAEDLEPAAAVVVEHEHPVTVEVASREFRVHLTLSQPGSLATGGTFTIQDGGPLDGLYLQIGSWLQATGDRAIIDRQGSRLRDLEVAP